MSLWIAEKAILTPRKSSVDQINAISSKGLLHREATFYPVLTVHVILEILPLIRGIAEQTHACWTPSTSPLHIERHGRHAHAKPLTQARTLK